MDINTTFEQYMNHVTLKDNGYIYGIWHQDGSMDENDDPKATFYVLDKNFNLIDELPAYDKTKYTKEVLSYINNDTRLTVICKDIDEVKAYFRLDYELAIKAQKIKQYRSENS